MRQRMHTYIRVSDASVAGAHPPHLGNGPDRDVHLNCLRAILMRSGLLVLSVVRMKTIDRCVPHGAERLV